MKKVFLKAISFTLALIMLSGAFCGCSDKGEPSITSDTDTVFAMQREVELTLNSKNAKFARDISEDDIILSGAFEGMSVTVERTKSTEAKIQLTGKMNTAEDSTLYDDGIIELAAGAFTDKYLQLGVSVGVQSPSIYIDNTSFKMENGAIFADIKTLGYDVSDELSASDVDVYGATVGSATHLGDGVIRISVKTKADTTDKAIEEIDGCEITLKGSAMGTDEDVSVVPHISKACFYYSNEARDITDDGIYLTLDLIPINGRFSDSFGVSDIELGIDLANGTLVSCDVHDGVATVGIRMKNGEDNVRYGDLKALIQLKEGSLINEWGTAQNEPVSYCKKIPEPLIFASADANYKFVRDFCDCVGGSSMIKALGPVGTVVNLFTGAVVTSYDLSNMFGFVDTGEPSEFDILCDKLDGISDHLRAQDDMLKNITEQLKIAELNSMRDKVNQFNYYLTKLDSSVASVMCYISGAADDFGDEIEGDMPTESLESISEKMLSLHSSGMTDAEINDRLSTDEKDLIDDWSQYYNKLFGMMKNAANDKDDVRYSGYNSMISRLEKAFEDLCDMILSSPKNASVFDVYDKLCTNAYLFDATSMPARKLYRESVKGSLSCAFSMLMIHYSNMNMNSVSDNPTIKILNDNYYEKAIKTVNESVVKREHNETYTPGLVTFYPQTYPTIQCRYMRISNNFGFQNMYTLGDTVDIEKQVKSYFDGIKKRMFINTLDDKEYRETSERMKNLGYERFSVVGENMGHEASIIANELGYTTQHGTKRCVFLLDYGSVSVSWKDAHRATYITYKRMEITFNNATLFDLNTGERIESSTYTMSYDEGTWDNVYILLMSSTH